MSRKGFVDLIWGSTPKKTMGGSKRAAPPTARHQRRFEAKRKAKEAKQSAKKEAAIIAGLPDLDPSMWGAE